MRRTIRVNILNNRPNPAKGPHEQRRLRPADAAVVVHDDAEELELDEDEQDEPEEPELREIAAEESEALGNGPDDALGLYLRQMGAIPLLNRTDEIEVAQRLERARNRFRSAALRCGAILRRTLTMFERIFRNA